MVVKCKIVVAEYARDTIFGMQLAEHIRERNSFFYTKAHEVARKTDKVGLLSVDGIYHVLQERRIVGKRG